MKQLVENALCTIRSITDFEPEIGMILGSGLGDYADFIENPIIIPYEKIKGFPVSTVTGHAGQFVMCTPRKKSNCNARSCSLL